MCHALGAKVKVSDLIPQFTPTAAVVKAEMFSNWFASQAGVTVRRCDYGGERDG
jgi:hypothetical protein